MSVGINVALALLQLVALAIPPIAVLLQMLRKSENLKWRTRKFSFGLAIASIVSFIGAGIAALSYLASYVQVPWLLVLGAGSLSLDWHRSQSSQACSIVNTSERSGERDRRIGTRASSDGTEPAGLASIPEP